MVGSFRLLSDGQVVFYELMVIETQDDTVIMSLKHFDGGLTGWEKRKQAVRFRLVEASQGHASFQQEGEDQRLVYALEDDSLVITLAGEEGEIRFDLQRPALAPPEPTAGGFVGLRTSAAHVPDLPAARAFYSQLLGLEPYFDEPFYVGFDVNGSELGLVPPEPEGDEQPVSTAFWKVRDLDATWARALSAGAVPLAPIEDVGGGVRVGVLQDPFGHRLGLLEEGVATAPAADSPPQ